MVWKFEKSCGLFFHFSDPLWKIGEGIWLRSVVLTGSQTGPRGVCSYYPKNYFETIFHALEFSANHKLQRNLYPHLVRFDATYSVEVNNLLLSAKRTLNYPFLLVAPTSIKNLFGRPFPTLKKISHPSVLQSMRKRQQNENAVKLESGGKKT